MRNLPAVRVCPACLFQNKNMVVNYGGPYFIQPAHLHQSTTNTRGYIALFIWLATKAVHLELMSYLQIDSFLAARKKCIPAMVLSLLAWSMNLKNCSLKMSIKTLFSSMQSQTR